MRKFIPLLFSYILSLCLCVSAFAVSNDIVHTHTGEESVSIYVRGEDYDTNVSAEVGTTEALQVLSTDINDIDSPIHTLILVDNSLSIPQNDRPKIRQLVSEMVIKTLDSNAMSQVAIGLISEDVRIICDYTNIENVLVDTAYGIEFYNQETYLTDALAGYIESNINKEILNRIIVISDGVDNRPVDSDKKTPEYLKRILKEYSIPLYAIGCKNKDKSNDLRLMNMKDLAESTPGYFCTLDMSENTLEIANYFMDDFNGVIYEVFLKPEQMDGTIKSIKLVSDNNSLSVDVRVPQKLEASNIIEETEPEDNGNIEETSTATITEEIEETDNVTIINSDKESEPPSDTPMALYLLIGAAVLVAAIIIILVMIMVKSKDRGEGFEAAPVDQGIDNNRFLIPPIDQELADGSGHDGETIMFWDNSGTQVYQVTLTDVAVPNNSFNVVLSGAVTIGRKAGCDIVIAYDKSISSKHCAIKVVGGKFFITDLQSSNGTFVNGNRISKDTEIFAGNKIGLGRLELRFDVIS